MAAINKYTIVNGASDTDLMKAVNSHIDREWRPIGGPFSVLNQNNEVVLLQAMVHSDRNAK